MMTQLAMHEILAQTAKLSKKDDKINFLKQHYTQSFHEALAFGYDDRIKWLLPETDPPYTPVAGDEYKSRFHQECRLQKLYYFVENGKGPNLNKMQRERMFIQLLESIDVKDAELLLMLKNKKLPKGITRQLIEDAYGKL